jgi:hypothetical protein
VDSKGFADHGGPPAEIVIQLGFCCLLCRPFSVANLVDCCLQGTPITANAHTGRGTGKGVVGCALSVDPPKSTGETERLLVTAQVVPPPPPVRLQSRSNSRWCRRSAIELDNAPESQTNSITVLTCVRQNNSLKLLGYRTTAG